MQQIGAARRVLVQALGNWWYSWTNLAAINVAWILCCITIVLAPPATLGLFHAASEAAHQRNVGMTDFFHGLRLYFRQSWLWGILNAIAIFLVSTNIRFYGQFRQSWAGVLLLVTLALALIWLTVQFYALPYLMKQEEKRLRTALRNGLFTVLASPLYTLVLLAAAGVIVGLTIQLPILLLLGGPPLLAILANQAVLERLATFGKVAQPAPELDDEDS
jgi:uncharacterized membrane protein YesL